MALTLFRPDPPDGPWVAVDQSGHARLLRFDPATADGLAERMGGAPAGEFRGRWDDIAGRLEIGDFIGPAPE